MRNGWIPCFESLVELSTQLVYLLSVRCWQHFQLFTEHSRFYFSFQRTSSALDFLSLVRCDLMEYVFCVSLQINNVKLLEKKYWSHLFQLGAQFTLMWKWIVPQPLTHRANKPLSVYPIFGIGSFILLMTLWLEINQSVHVFYLILT